MGDNIDQYRSLTEQNNYGHVERDSDAQAVPDGGKESEGEEQDDDGPGIFSPCGVPKEFMEK